MNPDILNQVEKFPLEQRGQLFTLILQVLNEDKPKIPEMFKPIVKRALSKPKDTKKERADKFQSEVHGVSAEFAYNHSMVDDFVNYWCDGEANPRCRKMRFEKQKTFDIKRRLATWAKNNTEWSKSKNQKKEDEQLKRFKERYG